MGIPACRRCRHVATSRHSSCRRDLRYFRLISRRRYNLSFIHIGGRAMLEGVSEVFKHFQGSRLASVALLAATGFLIFASRYVTWGPTVPDRSEEHTSELQSLRH